MHRLLGTLLVCGGIQIRILSPVVCKAMNSVCYSTSEMKSLGVRKAKVTHPTGDPNFSVMQSFPAGFTAEESDPFLMCDKFGPMLSQGKITDPDVFPVNWHPHRGMDILTYMRQGTGRHADSLGNRGEFASPGMQWISVGSGIEHAEGGGTPAGEYQDGFQIWVNVPSSRKMDDPRYGTEPPENLPILNHTPGVTGRLLAGKFEDFQVKHLRSSGSSCSVNSIFGFELLLFEVL
jgi:redox-sensitive bicupin YhaK (pirin superfamily)